ncbi:hypothetical protein DRN94_003150, partial [archaeon]|nr:hypothetical protein [archaeon]
MRRRFSLLALFAIATLPLLVVLAQTSDAPTCEIVAPDLGSYIGDWCAIWIRVDDPQGPQTVENVTLTVTTSPPKSKSFVYTTSRYNDTFFYANLSLPYGRLELTATAVDDSGLQGSHTIWVIHPFPVPYFNSFDTPTIHFFESWGEDLTNWTISPAGTWHVNYSNYHSPPSCFYTGPFSGPITITLVSPPINLTNWTGEAFLSFWSKINQTPSFTIPPTDYCCVEVSTDGRTWYLLSPYIVGYWSWSFFGRYSLTKYVGRIIYLRFKLVASSSGGGAGWWLDDIIVGNEKKVLVLDKLVKHFSCDSLDEWTYSGDWSVCTSTYHSYPSCICCGSFSGNKRYTITSPRISIPSVNDGQDIYLRLWWKFLIDQDCRVVVQLYYDGLWHSIGEFRSSLKRWRSSSFWITQTSGKRIKIRFMVEGYSNYASFQGLWFDDVTILVFNRRIATKGNITGWFSTENSLWRVTPIRCYSYNFSLWWGDTSTCLCYYGVSYPLDLWVDLRDVDHAYIHFHAYWNFTDPQSCASLRVCYDESEWVLLDTFMGARSSWTTRQYRINGGCVVRIRFQVEVYSSYAIGFFVDDFAVLPTTSDTASPNVSIVEPKSGAWFNFTNVTCVWQGEDDVGVCEYEVRVDGSSVAVELPPTTTNY